jgi:hypothetical protein
MTACAIGYISAAGIGRNNHGVLTDARAGAAGLHQMETARVRAGSAIRGWTRLTELARAELAPAVLLRGIT